MSLTSVIAAASEGGYGGVNHWIVGIVVFVILLALMGGLLIFGAGRPHS